MNRSMSSCARRMRIVHLGPGVALLGVLWAPGVSLGQAPPAPVPDVTTPVANQAAKRLTDSLNPPAIAPAGQPGAAPAQPGAAPAAAPAQPGAAPAAAPAQPGAAPAAQLGAAAPAPEAGAAAQPGAAAPAAAPGEHAAPGAALEGAHAPAGAAPAGEAHGAPGAVEEAAKSAAEHGAAAGHQAGHATPEGHSAGAHAATEGHGAAEGHAEGPVIENWFSCDYGPGKTHHHPPLGFAIINFAVFLFLLYRLAGKSMVEFLKNRHLSVRRALDEAAEVRKKAEEQLRRFEERTSRIDADVDTLLAGVRKEAEAERARIIAAAEAQADQLRKDAEAQIATEVARARAELRDQVAKAAIAAAEAILKGKLTEADNKRLVDEYVTGLEGQKPAQRTPRPTGTGRPA